MDKFHFSRGQRSAVRYKNGSVNMETDALTRDSDHTEVDVSLPNWSLIRIDLAFQLKNSY